jgi:pyruvate-formate lyase-activating enzyme
MPEFSKLFFIPGAVPMGLDPETGKVKPVREVRVGRKRIRCHGVAAFPESGIVRTHLPALNYAAKSYILPTWAYTAVGFQDDRYWICAFRIEANERWDPRNYDDRALMRAIRSYRRRFGSGPLLDHLERCATVNHCFAAKNLFLRRWEAPLPVSRRCNARCIGCLSLQPGDGCTASHDRLTFRPSKEEVVALAVRHLDGTPQAIVSFGQGCEGEPLTEHRLIAESIREIRRRTAKGTINLNTNGSRPERVEAVAGAGLDSIRISLNSARPSLYTAYFRPRGYAFHDVARSIALAREMGLYTMVNYLIFPGVTDQEAELEGLRGLIARTGVNFIHLKNLNIDPEIYIQMMRPGSSHPIGLREVVRRIRAEFPKVELGYFNRALR